MLVHVDLLPCALGPCPTQGIDAAAVGHPPPRARRLGGPRRDPRRRRPRARTPAPAVARRSASKTRTGPASAFAGGARRARSPRAPTRSKTRATPPPRARSRRGDLLCRAIAAAAWATVSSCGSPCPRPAAPAAL